MGIDQRRELIRGHLHAPQPDWHAQELFNHTLDRITDKPHRWLDKCQRRPAIGVLLESVEVDAEARAIDTAPEVVEMAVEFIFLNQIQVWVCEEVRLYVVGILRRDHQTKSQRLKTPDIIGSPVLQPLCDKAQCRFSGKSVPKKLWTISGNVIWRSMKHWS